MSLVYETCIFLILYDENKWFKMKFTSADFHYLAEKDHV